MSAEGVQPLGAYIKLRKNPGNYKRREKIWAKFQCFMRDLESRLLAMRKFFALEMLKIQPYFREIRGKVGKTDTRPPHKPMILKNIHETIWKIFCIFI